MINNRLGKVQSHAVDRGKEYFDFAFEMFVQGGPSDARLFGDVTHRGLFEAIALDALESGFT